MTACYIEEVRVDLTRIYIYRMIALQWHKFIGVAAGSTVIILHSSVVV